jgi:hypothetical protein
LLNKPGAIGVFEKDWAGGWERSGMRLFSYAALSNHWHLVVWALEDGQRNAWVQWLTVTRVRRWRAHWDSAGTAIRLEMSGQTEQNEGSNYGNLT